MIEFVLGFMAAAWAFNVGMTAYALWHYVYKPWKVVRLDQAGLKAMVEAQNKMIQDAIELVKIRSAEALSEEEMAYREARSRARSRQRVPQ